MTFSIVACDLATGEFGVAVQSKFFAVGAAVPYARAGAGAAATQAWFDPAHGPLALELLAGRMSAEDALTALVGDTQGGQSRQIGIVDRNGQAAAYTGPACQDWAGHLVGEGFCCQGNILAGPGVVAAMAEAFRSATGPLPERMVAALDAGQQAGGDRRGKQSAALCVARADSGFAYLGDRYIDIRVDDHPEPIAELDRLLRTYRSGFWGRLMDQEIALDEGVLQFVQSMLKKLGQLPEYAPGQWDGQTREAVRQFWADFDLPGQHPQEGGTFPRALFQILLREAYR